MKKTVEIVHISFLSEQERASVLLGNSPKKIEAYTGLLEIEKGILKKIADEGLEFLLSGKKFRSTRWELRVLAQKTLSKKEENQFWENIEKKLEKDVSQIENKLNRVFEKMDDFFKEVFKKTGDGDGDGDGEKKQ